MKISPSKLAALRHYQAQRDAEAALMGQCLVEFELGKARIIKRYAQDKDEMFRRLGALLYDFDVHRASTMKRIAQLVLEDGEVGNRALQELGVDDKSVQHQIDMTDGTVRVIKGGKLVEVE